MRHEYHSLTSHCLEGWVKPPPFHILLSFLQGALWYPVPKVNMLGLWGQFVNGNFYLLMFFVLLDKY